MKQFGDKRGQLFAMLNLVVREHIDSTTYINLLLSGLQIAREEEEERFDAIFTAMLCELYHPSLDCPGELFEHYENFKDQSSFEFPFVLQALAKHYSNQRDYKRATQFAQEYLNLAIEQNSLDDIQVARSTLLGIYSKTNNKADYFDLAQVYYATQDSIDQSTNLNAFAYLQGELDREKNERISSLNTSLETEERSRNRIILLSIAIAVLLITFLVNRVRLIKSQRTLLHQKQESANYLEKMNEVLKEQQAFKDRFYSNITHEFKTPLTVIQGSIQQLQMDESFLDLLKDDAQLANKFAAIQRNGTNLMGMVNQFLDLSKLDEKALSLELKEGDLSGYVYYLGESFESHFEDQKIEFEIETSEGSILTAYDAEKVKQIITNLLSNAAKYTPKGGKVLLSLLADEEHYTIKVSDNGVGISTEHLPFVFDRYYRVQKDQMPEGTGIGLSLCKELSETPGYQIQTVQFSGEVVGDGTLILPTSNGPSEAINVILVQDQSITTDSIFLAGAPAPEALTNVFGISQGDVGAVNRYYFYAENYELPVFQLNMGSSWSTSVSTLHASEELINSILEVQNETSISEVFPNPAQMNEQINFQLYAKEGQYTIQFFDQLGKEVHSEMAMNTKGSLSYQLPSDMAEGMYIYRVSNADGVILKKGNVMLQR
ncbi:MAG: ATP-binding protein [Flavobacteriales bacterium]|nr:ATP-binding protein [Flavobacteriales bacterium]